MKFVSTTGTMDDLISKLLVFPGAETVRFGNNVRPIRIFTDCSLAETGAFLHVYNRMSLEMFCNLRVRQVFTGQPATDPVDGKALMEAVWCNTHVQHAKAQYPVQKFRGKMTNALKNLLSEFMVATGQLLTLVKSFLILVQWLKVRRNVYWRYVLDLPKSIPSIDYCC